MRPIERSASAAWCLAILAGFALLLPTPCRATAVRYDGASEGGEPFPSDRLTAPDARQLTGLRISLPKPDCKARPSDCEDIDVLNELDGFNVQPRVVVPFDGAIDPSTVTARSVYLLEIGSSRRTALNQLQWYRPSNLLVGVSDDVLREGRRYLLVVTDEVRDAQGRSLDAAAFWRALEQAPADIRRYAWMVGAAVKAAGLSRKHVAGASVFTTQSVTGELRSIQAQIRDSTPSRVDFDIASTPGNPASRSSRAVFDVATISAITWHRQTGSAEAALPSFSDEKVPLHRLLLTRGSVAQIAYGRFYSPEYRDATQSIPTLPSGDQPRAQHRVPLIVQVFLPSGQKPERGWPVAVVGHGLSGSLYDDAWAIASQLASNGIATASIHYANHGGGRNGTLEVALQNKPSVALPSGGRGIDQDRDGKIGRTEGLDATRPRTIVFRRDGTRQTVIDLMQLVREIQVGVDVDGDGTPDLDASRISYVGHSGGAIYGTVFAALEPAIQAAALVCVGGPSADVYRIGGLRRLLGRTLASRTPSVLNGPPSTDPAQPSYAFVDAIPLRNKPIVSHDTAGAMPLQELLDRMVWVSQSGNPVAFAPYLRRAPLPGHRPKAILMMFARGDRLMTNPVTTAVIRAGGLNSSTVLYRPDQVRITGLQGLPKDPHNFFFDGVDGAEQPYALAAQRQIVMFLATKRVSGEALGDLSVAFETPINGPLPEDLGFDD